MNENIQIVYKGVDEITPYENNPRNNDEAVQYVANSIELAGFINPILVNEDGVILAGHTRLKAAKMLGMETVPVVYVEDLTEEQQRAFRLADNKVSEIAEWNEDLLGKELASILDINMDLFGFGEDAELGAELEDDRYTMAVNIPQYEITGECPELSELVDDERRNALVQRILESDVSQEEKDFLIMAAERHNVFNYRNIAEYYAHATPEMQELMEDSALVIIDVDDAIAKGYARLSDGITALMEEDDA